MTTTTHICYVHADWLAEGARRFGDDPRHWRFKCPSCATVSAGIDFIAVDTEGSRAAQECIGRVLNERDRCRRNHHNTPCNWAAFGLFRGPVEVTDVADPGRSIWVFEFAEPAHCEQDQS